MTDEKLADRSQPGNAVATVDVRPDSPPPSASRLGRINMADHPHWWTLALSLIAIVISVESFLESRRSRLLNEKLNRPIVRILSVTESGPVLNYAENTMVVNQLTVKNSGRTFAKNVRVALRSQLDDMRTGSSFRKFTDNDGAMSIQSNLGDLAPEDEDHVTFMANVFSKPPTTKFGSVEFSLVGLKSKGTLTYEDPLNGQTYSEQFCYILRPESQSFSRC